jgi:hypothetical protein
MESAHPEDRSDLKIGAYCIRPANAANRNYLAALRSLALIRKAAPTVTVNISNTENVNKKSGAKPIIDRQRLTTDARRGGPR